MTPRIILFFGHFLQVFFFPLLQKWLNHKVRTKLYIPWIQKKWFQLEIHYWTIRSVWSSKWRRTRGSLATTHICKIAVKTSKNNTLKLRQQWVWSLPYESCSKSVRPSTFITTATHQKQIINLETQEPVAYISPKNTFAFF